MNSHNPSNASKVSKMPKIFKMPELLRILRYIVQITMLIFLPGIFAMIFGQLKMLYTSIISGSFDPAKALTFMIEAIVVIILTALLGRFFCGWFCAFGTLSDLAWDTVGFVRRRIFKIKKPLRKIKIGERLDSILKYLKYAVLAAIIIAIWTAGVKTINTFSPWEAFAQLSQTMQIEQLLLVLSRLLPGVVILTAIIMISAFFERAFCRYLCPLGAVFSLTSRFKAVNIRKPRENCGPCALCSAKCPMGIDLGKMDTVQSTECINCFDCAAVCPRKNAHVSVFDNDLNPALAGAVAITAFTGLYVFSGAVGDAIETRMSSFDSQNLTAENDSAVDEHSEPEPSGKGRHKGIKSYEPVPTPDTVPAPESEAAPESTSVPDSWPAPGATPAPDSTPESETAPDSTPAPGATPAPKTIPDTVSGYKNGTYIGEGIGFMPDLKVEVTIKNGRITAIEVIESHETPSYLSAVADHITDSILESQSAQVDAVSGATYTCVGMMDAVADALSKAKE